MFPKLDTLISKFHGHECGCGITCQTRCKLRMSQFFNITLHRATHNVNDWFTSFLVG